MNQSGPYFTKMTPDPSVYLYEVLHKSFVKVNEEGTEAAASTSVEMRGKAERIVPSMVVDRPFFCAIREDTTGSILFMGTVANPEE